MPSIELSDEALNDIVLQELNNTLSIALTTSKKGWHSDDRRLSKKLVKATRRVINYYSNPPIPYPEVE